MRRMLEIATLCFSLMMVGQEAACQTVQEPKSASALGFRSRPSVVLISIDTLRADRLPAYGYSEGATPAIDSLRRDGLLVARAYSHTPLTLPSHVSLFTGRLPDDHGVRDNQGYPVDPGDGPFLPRDLAARGYLTGGAVSAFVLHRDSGVATGFEVYDDAVEVRRGVALGGQARPGEATLAAIEPWLRDVVRRPPGRAPFFLFLHLFEPHSPYTPPEPFASRFKQAYDGEIAAADQVVGQLLNLLRELGVYQESLVVLFSDHGEGLGDHGEEEHGLFLYREALEVPLILKLPGNQRAGETVQGPAQLVDVYPTVLDVLGIEAPEGLAGASLLRPLDSQRPLYAETFYPRLHFGWSELRSVISGPWHLIDGPDPELFDLVSDPGERRNLWSNKAPMAATLDRHLEPHRGELAAPTVVDPGTRARLAALGYLGGSVEVPPGPLPDPKAQLPTLEALRQARRHLDAGDSEAALRAYRRVLRDNPRLLDAWIALRDLLRRQGRLKDAYEAQRRALEVSGGDPYLLADLALLEAELGRVEQARVALAAVAESGLPVVETRLRMALLLARGGHLTAAAEELQPLASAQNPAAMNALARVHSEAGEQKAAQLLLDRVLAKDPSNAQAHEHLGLVALRRSDWSAARSASERALALEAERPEAWNNLGVARFQLGEQLAALEAWQRAVDLDPQLYDTLYNLGTQALELGRPELARSALQRFLDVAPEERYAGERRRVRVLLQRFVE